MKNKISSGVSTQDHFHYSIIGSASRVKRMACFKALAFLVIYLSAVPLPAQTAEPPRVRATITFANGTSLTVRSNRQEKFRLVGILPGETLNIQLQLPPRFVNAAVAVQALDGGIAPEDVAIAPDGTVALEFHAGIQPGLYRLLLTSGGRPALLQFWAAAE